MNENTVLNEVTYDNEFIDKVIQMSNTIGHDVIVFMIENDKFNIISYGYDKKDMSYSSFDNDLVEIKTQADKDDNTYFIDVEKVPKILGTRKKDERIKMSFNDDIMEIKLISESNESKFEVMYSDESEDYTTFVNLHKNSGDEKAESIFIIDYDTINTILSRSKIISDEIEIKINEKSHVTFNAQDYINSSNFSVTYNNDKVVFEKVPEKTIGSRYAIKYLSNVISSLKYPKYRIKMIAPGQSEENTKTYLLCVECLYEDKPITYFYLAPRIEE